MTESSNEEVEAGAEAIRWLKDEGANTVDIARDVLTAAAQVSGDAPWTKNLVMSLSRDENGQVIGVDGMFMVRTADVGLLPGSLRTAAEALLEHAGLMPIYSSTEDTPPKEEGK